MARSGEAHLIYASLRTAQMQDLGTEYIGYSYVDDEGNEEIYWFPVERSTMATPGPWSTFPSARNRDDPGGVRAERRRANQESGTRDFSLFCHGYYLDALGPGFSGGGQISEHVVNSRLTTSSVMRVGPLGARFRSTARLM